jgi:hypothetical protein
MKMMMIPFLLLRQTPLFSQIKDNKLARTEKGNEEPFENGDKILSEVLTA